MVAAARKPPARRESSMAYVATVSATSAGNKAATYLVSSSEVSKSSSNSRRSPSGLSDMRTSSRPCCSVAHASESWTALGSLTTRPGRGDPASPCERRSSRRLIATAAGCFSARPTCEALHERGLVHARRIGESGEGEAELVRWHLTVPLINAFTKYCRRPERNPVPHGSVIID
jgi:hypothetical protein